MRRIITITIEVDPVEYNGAVDTPEGVCQLVNDMLCCEADFPEEFKLECEGVIMEGHL
jgi:hypothetical protein